MVLSVHRLYLSIPIWTVLKFRRSRLSGTHVPAGCGVRIRPQILERIHGYDGGVTLHGVAFISPAKPLPIALIYYPSSPRIIRRAAIGRTSQVVVEKNSREVELHSKKPECCMPSGLMDQRCHVKVDG
jgi:hypothetical protein